jgi:hypothetical protein
MLQLVLSVCSIVQGAACHELPPTVIPQSSMMACFMASQIEAAKWISENPKFYVKRMVCRPLGRIAKM